MTDFGIGSWIRKRSVKSTDTRMISFENHEMTYREFGNRVLRLADALRARGIESGDRVAYLGDNHPSFIETMFATCVLGAIFVPLNTRLAVGELAYALGDSGSRLLVYSRSLASAALAAAAEVNLDHLIVVEGEAAEQPRRPSTSRVLASSLPFENETDVLARRPGAHPLYLWNNR